MIAAAVSAGTPPLAGVFSCGAEGGATPSSNHGVKIFPIAGPQQVARGEETGIWDYLTLTVNRGALRSKDEHGEVQARAHGAEYADNESAFVLPTTICDWLFPGHALQASPFEKRGWQGYKQRADLFAPGLAVPVGLIARDGNADTVCVSITGAGMFAVNLKRAKLALEHYGANITRIDAAFDDLAGEFLPLDDLKYDARIGEFNASSKPSARTFVDDLGTGAGCALYVGKKGNKQLNVYEKGKQQGDQFSPHVRAEVRLWANNRFIPVDVIDSPLALILGAYPRLGHYLPNVAPSRAKTMRAKVDASAGAMTEWLRQAAGKSLGALRQAATLGGLSADELLDQLTRDGMPSRFGAIPEEVAIYRTAEHLQNEATR